MNRYCIVIDAELTVMQRNFALAQMYNIMNFIGKEKVRWLENEIK